VRHTGKRPLHRKLTRLKHSGDALLMIRYVEEHWSTAEAKRSRKQLLSALCIGRDEWPDLIGADTLAPHHETGVRN
jgi:hypothetical protein